MHYFVAKMIMLDFLIHAAHAACTPNVPPGTVCLINPIGTTSVPELVGRIIRSGLGIIGSITFLMFVWGGFQWLTSAGNEKKVTAGKDTMKWAAVGLIIVFSAVAMVSFVLKGITTVTK